MYLPLDQFAPEIKLGLVSASRNCFPRALSEKRTQKLKEAAASLKISLTLPEGRSQIIESRADAEDAARQLEAAGCDAAILFLGNFSPEIEDATFVKHFSKPVMIIAAAEESGSSLGDGRGDALCGLLSATMAVRKRGLDNRVFLPENPIVDAKMGATAIARFKNIMQVVKGIRGATIGLFGPRPRDFETCNYNIASLASIGVEVEELGLFDLMNEVTRVRQEANTSGIVKDMTKQVACLADKDFMKRLGDYEKAILNLRDRFRLSGAATQCWVEQEFALKHVPCFINARMAGRGFPVACENDAYSLVAELMGQYATGGSATILDVNHSIPRDLHPKLSKYPGEDLVGMFHCGNTDPCRVKKPEMKYQLIMKRCMEPESKPDISRGTVEGQINASPITMVQLHGTGDRLCAAIIEGEFLDLDPKTFGCTGTAYMPGFRRFYRHVLLGRFHHHAGIAFGHCGGVLWDALQLLGAEKIYTPKATGCLYPSENPFADK